MKVLNVRLPFPYFHFGLDKEEFNVLHIIDYIVFMNRPLPRNLFVVALLTWVAMPLNAQVHLTSAQERIILNTCQDFKDEYNKFMMDSGAVQENLADLCTKEMVEYIQIQRGLYEADRYLNFRPNKAAVIAVVNDSTGVYGYVSGYSELKINVCEKKGKWAVCGLEGYIINKALLKQAREGLTSYEKTVLEYDKIEKSVERFFDGWREINSVGYSATLKEVTTPQSYRFMKLRHINDSIIERRQAQFKLKEFETIYFTNDSTATVETIAHPNVKREYVWQKVSGSWRMIGERKNLYDKQALEDLTERNNHLKKGITFKPEIEAVNQAVEAFLIKDDPSLLKARSTREFFQFMGFCKQMLGKWGQLKYYGINMESYTLNEYVFKDDSAIYSQLDSRQINFVQDRGVWKLAGINGVFSENLTPKLADEFFSELVDYFSLNHSGKKEDENKAERDFNGDLDVYDISHIEEPEPDEAIYHRMYAFAENPCFGIDAPAKEEKKPPTVEEMTLQLQQMLDNAGSQDALYKYIAEASGFDQSAKMRTNEQVVFVRFIIEKDGSVSNVAVINPLAYNAKKAIQIMEMMPKWKPAKFHGGPARCERIVGIRFEE